MGTLCKSLSCVLGLLLSGCAPLWQYSWNTPKSPINTALVQLLESTDKQITVAPIVTSVETTFSAYTFAQQGVDQQQWKSAIRSELLTMAESELFRTVGQYKNFKVVDRTTIDRVMADLKLSMAVSNDERLNVGKTLGATHLVFCELMRTPNPNPWNGRKIVDTITARLIDVPTGTVLASQIMTKYQ